MPSSYAVQCSNCGGVTTIQDSDDVQAGQACKFCGTPLDIPDYILSARKPKVAPPPTIRPPFQEQVIQGQPIQISIGQFSTSPRKVRTGMSLFSCLFTLIIVAASFGIPLVLAGSQVGDMFDSVRNQINNTFNTDSVDVNRTLKGFDSRANTLTYSPDGRLIGGAGSDQIILWDARSGAKVATIEQGFGSSEMVFSHDSQELLTNDGSSLVFYSTSDGRELKRFDCRCSIFDLSPDEELIVMHTYEDQILLVSSYSGATIRDLGSVSDYLSQIGFSPDGRFVVAMGSGGKLMAWNVTTGQNIFDGESNLTSADQFAFHPTENTLVLGESAELEFYAVDEQGLRFVRSNDLGESFFSIQGIAYSPDGKEIALGNFFDGVWVWNVEDKRVTHKLKNDDGIDTVAFSPDGRMVIGAGWFGDIYEWQVHGESQSVQQPTQAPRPVDVTATFTPTPASAFPALMRSPTPAPLVAATPSSPVDCSVRPAAQAARIRSGPGTEYAVMGNLAESTSANGQSTGADNFTWWRLADGRGWVREDVVEESGHCDQLPQAS